MLTHDQKWPEPDLAPDENKLFAELQKLLRVHELVKLRFLGADRDERAVLGKQIADEGRCVCVAAVGHIALFYRQNPDPKERRVQLG